MKTTIIKLIELYRKYSANTPPRCRYYPTCSKYALDAINKYGAFKGGLLAAYRILRCNPFSKGGYDPVK